MSHRRCRDCPAIFTDDGGDSCPACRSRASVAKDPAAVALGRRGGMKGGPARAAALSPERRSYLASKAARARWSKPRVPKARRCEVDGHHACEHYAALLEALRRWVDDTEWCYVCGAETPQDAPADAKVPHVAGCALEALMMAPSGRRDRIE